MDNFLATIQSIAYAIKVTSLGIIRHQASWGFITGFSTATGLYAFITSENPRNLPAILTKDPQTSFSQLAPRAEGGTFQVSYTAFQREYNRVRLVFYLALFAFLILIAIAMLRY
ncbi:hypothetical protein HZC53_02845 [Candidatus Uhrbacteria bacterium]|nr:hypothetical protein [Candidatus Uhrbacteria bacterium]